MSTYVMYGKYSIDAINTMSATRTDKGRDLIQKYGGEVKSRYALWGEKDILL